MQRETLPPISEEELARRLPKRRLSLFSQFLMIVITFLLLLIAAYFIWQFYAMRRFHDAVAELRAAGFATSRTELLENYVIAEPNPGPLWQEAAGAVQASGTQGLPFFTQRVSDPPPPGEPWEQMESVRDFLDRNSDALVIVERAANSKNPARYERWFQQNSGVKKSSSKKSSSVSGHLALSKMLSLAAYVHAHDEDIAAATTALENGLSVSLSLADEPSLLSQAVSVACFDITANSIEGLMELDFVDQQLADLQKRLRQFDPCHSLARGLEGETVSAIYYLSGATKWPTQVQAAADDAGTFIEQMVMLLETTNSKDWAEIRFTADSAGVSNAMVTDANGWPVRYGQSLNALKGMRDMVIKQQVVQARLSVLDAAIASKRFKRKYGELPNSLEVMVPEFLPAVPLDPLSKTGEPLCFLSDGPVFKIYSRGFDALDDGGDSRWRSELSGQRFSNRYQIDIVAELKTSGR